MVTTEPGLAQVQLRKRFFTVAETAELLGVSEPTLYRAIRAGEFPVVKVRGRYVVPAKAIDALEEEAVAAAWPEPDDPALMAELRLRRNA